MKHITCSQIIRNEFYYDWKNSTWIRFDEEERYRIFHLFRDFVAKTSRGRRRQRIHTEMGILRDAFD